MLRSRSKTLKIIIICFSMPLLVNIAASLVQPDAAVAGSFSSSCRDEKANIEPESGKVLISASCEDEFGINNVSNVVISDYVSNHEGELAWDHKGGFQASCSDIKLNRAEKKLTLPQVPFPVEPPDSGKNTPYDPMEYWTLSARCGDGKGGYKQSALSINDKLSNQNGVLAVDDF